MEQSYKEKYEQAIERLKQWDREHPCAGYVLSDRDKFIFPELAENKDERIRKELLVFCRTLATGRTSVLANNIDFNKWLAWLEKQGEQKSLNDVAKEITKNKETATSFLKSCGIMNANGELADEYKIAQDEQKPTNSYCQENCKGFQETGKCFADGMCKARRKAEQKPAEQQMYWTEEEIEPIISDYLCGREHYGGMIGRLCHLKPKQKQAEWGEDDKAFLDDILCKLEHDLVLNKDEKDWLKSLRPQPKQEWSEEDKDYYDAIIAKLEVTQDDALLTDNQMQFLKSIKQRIGE